MCSMEPGPRLDELIENFVFGDDLTGVRNSEDLRDCLREFFLYTGGGEGVDHSTRFRVKDTEFYVEVYAFSPEEGRIRLYDEREDYLWSPALEAHLAAYRRHPRPFSTSMSLFGIIMDKLMEDGHEVRIYSFPIEEHPFYRVSVKFGYLKWSEQETLSHALCCAAVEAFKDYQERNKL